MALRCFIPFLSFFQLNGLGIAREHCVIKTVGDGPASEETRLLHSFNGATCYVNGFLMPPDTDRELVIYSKYFKNKKKQNKETLIYIV